jgi:hypothetical protein
MGMLGEHYSIAVYLGPEGLDGFWRVHSERLDYPEEILEIPHLQASFENRNTLTQQDRDKIKELGLKFRGRQAWPMFRSYRPGYFPWYLEAQEARFLTRALEQVLEVAPRVQEDPGLLEAEEEDLYLVRIAEESTEGSAWKDRMIAIPETAPKQISISMDVQALKRLKRLSRSKLSLEADLFLFPASFGERGERPQCAHMLLIVEKEQGMVLGSEFLESAPQVETMYGRVPSTFVRILEGVKLVPTEVRVRSYVLEQLLAPLADELGFKIRWTPALPALQRAKAFLTQRFT